MTHGTLSAYKTYRCRCVECRAANARYAAENRWTAQRRPVVGDLKAKAHAQQKALYALRLSRDLWRTRFDNARVTISALEAEVAAWRRAYPKEARRAA